MIKLILGVLLWSIAHLLPAVAADFRQRVIAQRGEGAFKGVIALAIVASIALIIWGWKSTVPEFLYLPPIWGRHLAALLVLVAFVLFAASHGNNNIRRFVRHPQLTGVIVWGLAHLLANGESRSIVLFGGLTLWALIEIVLINRRDGAWVKPGPAPLKRDVIAVVAGLFVYLVLAFSHQWLFGVSPFA
jgi:uncharacterized membrane protein